MLMLCANLHVFVLQLRMMEAELNALSSSNQQLRSQLELSAQQVRLVARAVKWCTTTGGHLQVVWATLAVAAAHT